MSEIYFAVRFFKIGFLFQKTLFLMGDLLSVSSGVALIVSG